MLQSSSSILRTVKRREHLENIPNRKKNKKDRGSMSRCWLNASSRCASRSSACGIRGKTFFHKHVWTALMVGAFPCLTTSSSSSVELFSLSTLTGSSRLQLRGVTARGQYNAGNAGSPTNSSFWKKDGGQSLSAQKTLETGSDKPEGALKRPHQPSDIAGAATNAELSMNLGLNLVWTSADKWELKAELL